MFASWYARPDESSQQFLPDVHFSPSLSLGVFRVRPSPEFLVVLPKLALHFGSTGVSATYPWTKRQNRIKLRYRLVSCGPSYINCLNSCLICEAVSRHYWESRNPVPPRRDSTPRYARGSWTPVFAGVTTWAVGVLLNSTPPPVGGRHCRRLQETYELRQRTLTTCAANVFLGRTEEQMQMSLSHG